MVGASHPPGAMPDRPDEAACPGGLSTTAYGPQMMGKLHQFTWSDVDSKEVPKLFAASLPALQLPSGGSHATLFEPLPERRCRRAILARPRGRSGCRVSGSRPDLRAQTPWALAEVACPLSARVRHLGDLWNRPPD